VRFAAWSSISIGALMLLQWAFFLGTGSVPEVSSEPLALAFHLVAEGATSLVLLYAGVSLLRRWRSGIVAGLVGNGMLLYTVIVSPGYFAQAGQWPLVAMFLVLVVVALAAIVKLARALQDPSAAS